MSTTYLLFLTFLLWSGTGSTAYMIWCLIMKEQLTWKGVVRVTILGPLALLVSVVILTLMFLGPPSRF